MNDITLKQFMGIVGLAVIVLIILGTTYQAVKTKERVMTNHLLLHQNHAGSIGYSELEQMAPLHSYAYGDALIMLEYFDVDEPQDTYIAHVMTPENGWTHITSNSVEGMFTQVRKILK